jgi:hypothetical protein
MSVFAASTSGGSSIAGLFILIPVLLGFYFLPSIVGTARKMHNAGSIFVINFFLGWSVVGWVVALAMACGSHRAAAVQQTFVQNHQVPAPPSQPQRPAGPQWDHARQAYVYQDPVTSGWLVQGATGAWSPIQQSASRPETGPFLPPGVGGEGR